MKLQTRSSRQLIHIWIIFQIQIPWVLVIQMRPPLYEFGEFRANVTGSEIQRENNASMKQCVRLCTMTPLCIGMSVYCADAEQQHCDCTILSSIVGIQSAPSPGHIYIGEIY